MTGRAKQLEVNTTETRTPSEFSLAGSFPDEEPSSQDATVIAHKASSDQELRQSLHAYQKAAARYRHERDQHARHLIAQEEATAHAEASVERLTDEVEKLRIEIHELRVTRARSDRELTAETYTTAATSQAATWRSRASDPDEKLTGTNPDKYGPWRFDVDLKLETDSPMFPTDRLKVRYALAQLDLPIFTTMKALVARERDTTLKELMDEIEHYTGVATQRRDARRELQRVTQRPNERINDYYHRLSSLWQKAGTPEEDRVDQFLTTMSPTLSISLASGGRSLRELLDDARTVESINKEAQHKTANFHYRRPPAPDADRYQSTPNSRFGSVARKPEGWEGPWHNPQVAPKKLDDAERRLLTSQGRCWTCRGSGHRSKDSCCPKSTYTLANFENEGEIFPVEE
jgi:hypothetical protein